MDKEKILEEPFGVVKTATIRTFIQCAQHLLDNENKPMRIADIEKSGVSHFMAADFTTFGTEFGLLETQPGTRRHQLTYRLSKTGLAFYKPLIEWEKKLRKQKS